MKNLGLSLPTGQTKGRLSEISSLFLLPRQVSTQGSGMVPDFSVLKFNIAANFLSFYHCISNVDRLSFFEALRYYVVWTWA